MKKLILFTGIAILSIGFWGCQDEMTSMEIKESSLATPSSIQGDGPQMAKNKNDQEEKDEKAFIKFYQKVGLSEKESKEAAQKSWKYVNSKEFKKTIEEMDDLSKKQAKYLVRLEAMAAAAKKIQKMAKKKGITGGETLKELQIQYPWELYNNPRSINNFPEKIVEEVLWINKQIKKGKKPFEVVWIDRNVESKKKTQERYSGKDWTPELKVSLAIDRVYGNEIFKGYVQASHAAHMAQIDVGTRALEYGRAQQAYHQQMAADFRATQQQWDTEYAAYLDSWQIQQDARAASNLAIIKLLNEPLRNSSAQYEIKAAENALIDQVWFSSIKTLLESTESTSEEWTAPNSPKAYESKAYYHPITSSSVQSLVNSSAPVALGVGKAQQQTRNLMTIASGSLPGNVKGSPFVSINVGPAGCTGTWTSGNCGAAGVSVGYDRTTGRISASYTVSSPLITGVAPAWSRGIRFSFKPTWLGIKNPTIQEITRVGVQYGVQGGKITSGMQFVTTFK